MGSFICLSNDEHKICPLSWKSKIIDKVAPDIKSAETLALEAAIDESIYLASMISEVYSQGKYKIPIIVNEDSRGLVDSLYSTKKVKRKTMRIVISCLQQYLKQGIIKEVNHVSSENQLSDILTKKGVNSSKIIYAVSEGTITDQIQKSEGEKYDTSTFERNEENKVEEI